MERGPELLIYPLEPFQISMCSVCLTNTHNLNQMHMYMYVVAGYFILLTKRRMYRTFCEQKICDLIQFQHSLFITLLLSPITIKIFTELTYFETFYAKEYK